MLLDQHQPSADLDSPGMVLGVSLTYMYLVDTIACLSARYETKLQVSVQNLGAEEGSKEARALRHETG